MGMGYTQGSLADTSAHMHTNTLLLPSQHLAQPGANQAHATDNTGLIKEGPACTCMCCPGMLGCLGAAVLDDGDSSTGLTGQM